MEHLLLFPSEILYYISSFLNGRERRNYLLTCKTIHSAVLFHKSDKRINVGDYRLSSDQNEALRKINECGDSFIIFNAPPSLGKTLISLLFLLNKKGKHVINVPPSLVDNWLHDIEKFFPSLYHTKAPEKSSILVYSAHNKAHRSYLTSYHRAEHIKIVLAANSIYHKIRDLTSFDWKIFDEAHSNYDWVFERDYRKTLIISASKINMSHTNNNNIRALTTIHEISLSSYVMKDHIPLAKDIYTTTALNNILPDLLRENDHIIVFFSSVNNYRVPQTDAKVFIHKQSNTKVLNQFYEHSGNAIFLTTYKKLGTGHNLKGSLCIFTDANAIHPVTLLQAEGRFLRITNDVPEVKFFFLCDDEEAIWRMRHMVALVRVEQEYDVKLIYHREGWSVLRMLATKGHIHLEDLSSLEILYYANIKRTGASKVIKFCKDKGIEDLELKKKIMKK